MDFTERLQMYLEGGMITEQDIEDINKIIDLFEKKYNVKLNEENSGVFIAHLCAAYGRLTNGEEIEELPDVVIDELKTLDTYDLSKEILSEIMLITHNPLNETEQGYALLHINNLIAGLKQNGEWHTELQ